MNDLGNDYREIFLILWMSAPLRTKKRDDFQKLLEPLQVDWYTQQPLVVVIKVATATVTSSKVRIKDPTCGDEEQLAIWAIKSLDKRECNLTELPSLIDATKKLISLRDITTSTSIAETITATLPTLIEKTVKLSKEKPLETGTEWFDLQPIPLETN
jgi:hypothetical protein